MAKTWVGDQRKGSVVGSVHGRKRELQVVRAEGQACRRAADALCAEMAADRAKLKAAVAEYGRRKAGLEERVTVVHRRLAKVLRDRSAAERSLETVRDYVENELKARRTASTVHAYRLDERWQRLHNRYRGFALDVLAATGSGRKPSDNGVTVTRPRQGSTVPVVGVRGQTAKVAGGGRRFYTVADKFGAQYRRESLRTTRSLHALLVGYLRQSTDEDGGDADTEDPAVRLTSPPSSSTRHRRRCNQRRKSLTTLDNAEPERVLDKLRVMQEQCARIAERVRRRTDVRNVVDGDEELDGSGRGPSKIDSCNSGNGHRQIDLLSEARQRLLAGGEYVHRIRQLTDRAAADVGRDRLKARELLARTCATCDGRAPGPDRSCTAVEMAGRLERACFALFTRLDQAGTDVRRRSSSAGHRAPLASRHDLVASCLHAVQTQRANTVRRARDIAFRVHDFRRAVDRLLLAMTTGEKSTVAGGCPRRTTPRHSRDESSATARRPPPLPVTMTVSVSSRKPSRKMPAAVSSSMAAPSSTNKSAIPVIVDSASENIADTDAIDVGTVTVLCPPSIGVIEYE